MKLCFICPEYPPGPHGGVGTFVQDMARALVQRGHSVRVAGVYPESYPAPDFEEDQGVRIWRVREGEGHLAWVYARCRLYGLVRRWIKAGELDLVESPDCYGWFAGWPRLPVPLISRAHGSLTYYARELGQRVASIGHWLEVRSYRRVDAWSAVSRHAGELTARLFGLSSGPDAVLYNPVAVPVAVVPYSMRDGHRVVFTGTLTQKKGIGSVIDAWPTVLAECPLASLHIFGKGALVPNGGSTAEELRARLPDSASDSVHFYGHVRREVIMQALGAAKAAVLPSYTETFGFCAVEAMAAECPTIYTKRSCGPEIVQDGVEGLLVDPDRPVEIARAVVAILKSPEFGNRLSTAGKARVLRAFSLETLLPANEVFFEQVIHMFSNRHRSGTT